MTNTTMKGDVMSDMAALTVVANTTRTARAQVRRDLASGLVSVSDVLADPPECMAAVLVVDLLRWQRYMGDEKLRRLNVAAIRDGVNLCLPVRMCSQRTREWLEGMLPIVSRAAGCPARLGRRWAA